MKPGRKISASGRCCARRWASPLQRWAGRASRRCKGSDARDSHYARGGYVARHGVRPSDSGRARRAKVGCQWPGPPARRRGRGLQSSAARQPNPTHGPRGCGTRAAPFTRLDAEPIPGREATARGASRPAQAAGQLKGGKPPPADEGCGRRST